MRVKVLYRNYIPLYSGYCSFWLTKMKDIEIIIPPVKSNIKKLYSIYKKLKNYKIFSTLISNISNYLFKEKTDESVDLYYCAGVIPSSRLKPYIIDFESIYELFGFVKVNTIQKKEMIELLLDDKCISIVPWSKAAEQTMYDLYPEKIEELRKKTTVVYPALPLYYGSKKYIPDYSIVQESKTLKLLTVGKEFYRKGILEVLEAVKRLELLEEVELYCISTVPKEIIDHYQEKNIHFLAPEFTHDEIIKKFFLTCDVFVMPTHEDTFGMVFMEALSSGMPVITTNQFALPEFIEEGINGFFVNATNLPLNEKNYLPTDQYRKKYEKLDMVLVEELVKTISQIYKDANILNELKKNSYTPFIPNGKFSLEVRNNRLQNIFINTK